VLLCGFNIVSKREASQIERVRFSVLKLSDGELGTLRRAIRSAEVDWRSLVHAAGFDDPNAYESWLPEQKW
jgi:hypothetical protein